MHERIVDPSFHVTEAVKVLRPMLRSLTLSISLSHPGDDCLPLPPLLVPETAPALMLYAAELRAGLADSYQSHVRWAQAAQSCWHLPAGGVAAVWDAVDAWRHLVSAAAQHSQHGGDVLASYALQGPLVTRIGQLDRLAARDEEDGFFGDPIDVCSRADLLASFLLFEADPQLCREAGYPPVSVAFTLAAWEDCVAWTDYDTSVTGQPQDECGRLRDVLLMGKPALRKAWARARQTRDAVSEVFTLVRVPRTDRPAVATHVALRLHLGPGEDGIPVVTIGQPDED